MGMYAQINFFDGKCIKHNGDLSDFETIVHSSRCLCLVHTMVCFYSIILISNAAFVK